MFCLYGKRIICLYVFNMMSSACRDAHPLMGTQISWTAAHSICELRIFHPPRCCYCSFEGPYGIYPWRCSALPSTFSCWWRGTPVPLSPTHRCIRMRLSYRRRYASMYLVWMMRQFDNADESSYDRIPSAVSLHVLRTCSESCSFRM